MEFKNSPQLMCLLVLLTANTGYGGEVEPYQNLNSIRSTAENFVLSDNPSRGKQRVEVKAATLDPRLQLSHCATPLDAFYPHERNRGSRITVGVRCEKPKPWSLYVSVSVKRYDQVISASRHLPKGHKIGREDLKTVEMEVAQLANHYINKPEHAIGMIVKRGIRAGKAIRSSNLHPPLIIRKGDSVSIISSTSGFDIRMSGKALVDGAKGERIKVQNLSSKRTVEGKVISEGLVQVGSL